MQISDAATLWKKFILYRRPTRQAYEKKNPPDGRNSIDVNLSGFHLDGSHQIAQLLYGGLEDDEDEIEGLMSTYDVERLMEFQVSELQSR